MIIEGTCAASSHLIRSASADWSDAGRRSTTQCPPQTSPSLAHDPGLRLAIWFRPKDMARSHQRRKLLKLGFHRRTPQFPRFSVSHQFATPESGNSFLGCDGGYSLLYYRRADLPLAAIPRGSIRMRPRVA